jgi:hypothetical protein
VIKDNGFYAYIIHNIIEKHFSIRIAPVRSRGGSLVFNNVTVVDVVTPSFGYVQLKFPETTNVTIVA